MMPSAVVGTPTYLSPLSRRTPVMTRRNGSRSTCEESSEPTMTAGTLPMMIDAVSANCDVAEQQRAERRGERERDRLGEVGADELVVAQVG